jgi:hypothetical protein
MTRSIAAAAVFAIALPTFPTLWRQSEPLFNPVGKWTVSTTSDTGQSVKVSVQIAGKVGAYTGHAISPEGQTLPLRDLATTPNGMIALFDLPQGAIVCRMVKDPKGTGLIGAWGQVEQTVPLTAVKDGGVPPPGS